MARFIAHYLRTTDVDRARAFYDAVLSPAPRQIFPLHEQALARGASAHWLGFLGVDDVDRAIAAFVERGATSLGPKWRNPEGLEAGVLRDPGGAVIAVGRQEPRPAQSGFGAEVAWHQLNTNDVARAKSNYGELFGWEFRAPIEVPGHGAFHPFAFERGGAVVGAFADVAGRAGVHPHWLFFARVPDLGAAVDAVKRGGGLVAGTFAPPEGGRMAVCDDPQGAAFALRGA